MLLTASLVLGCSGGGTAEPSTAATSTVSPTASAPPDTTDTTTESTTTSVPPVEPGSTASDEGAATIATAPIATAPIATVPDDRVPGIDSEDPFCRAWSEYAGSFQTLTFASVAASDPFAAARLEVIASAAVSSAAATIDTQFPEAVADERALFVDDVIGPFARRAQRAMDALDDAGLSPEEIERLGEAWLIELADLGADEIEVVVDVPDDLVAAVDVATSAFAADVPPIAADPSLVTSADTPATFGYLAEFCPDQGVLAGNDAIG
jgi:hypothetical protein